MIRLLLALTLISFTAPLQAAWLALCDGGGLQPTLPGDFRFNTASGETKILRVLEHDPPESCASTILSVSADSVQWFAQLSSGQAAQIGKARTVVLQGLQKGKHFAGEVSMDSGVAAPSQPLPWPLYLNLLDHLEITPFGLEERASLERSKTGITFYCHAGQRPAGFVLPAEPTLLPQLPGLKLNLDLLGKGNFIWAASQSGSNRDPIPLSKLQASNRRRTETIDLAPMLNPQNTWNNWTLLCPNTEAKLTLSALQLTASTMPPRGRATWIWRDIHWRQADATLWRKLANLNITTLYITVPLSDNLTRVADIEALQAFITKADKQGIAVWAVAGDPQAVLVSERESWLKRAKAYADYNRDAPESARLKGVQYDIEPYLAPGYANAPEVWKQAYVDTLAALHQVSPLPLDVAVPVWWAEETLHGKLLLEAMTASVDSVTVMDYRTDPWRIQQQTMPFLVWGAHHGKPVRIALEAGPVADETRLVFHRAETGNLWVTHVGEMTLLLRLATPGANAGSETFNSTQQTTVSGEAVSFHGRPEEMAKRLPQLEHALGAWPTFAGLALHEVLTF